LEEAKNMKHYIIPIFIPHCGCTHECIFCNQRRITGVATTVTATTVGKLIQNTLSRITQPRHIEVAFYGGSFTGLPFSLQRDLLTPAYEFLQAQQIHGIRLSTRPDCISAKILEQLRQYGVSIIELGVQSMDNRVLDLAGRGHNEADIREAVTLIRQTQIRCGIQLMPGLPGENYQSLQRTARKVIELRPDFIRIYPTLVIADTKLADLFQEGMYQPLTLEEGIRRAAALKLLFERENISVIRTGLQATEELSSCETVLAGPYHPAFGEMVEAYIFFTMLCHCLERAPKGSSIVIHHHQRDTSKIRGIKNENMRKLRKKYSLNSIKLLQNTTVIGQIIVEINDTSYVINRKMLYYL
jgi:histone acetyltransferase (RNA polymerase elongator complex component)